VKSKIVPGLITGVIGGALNVTFAVSLAALIFTGRFAGHLAAGVGIALAASTVVVVVGALRSGARPVIYGVQEKPAILLAIIAAALADRVLPEALLPTLLVAFSTASLGTGALLVLVGRLRLGKVVRFIPYPVVGGFLAGTGWLLVLGSLTVLAGAEVSVSRLSVLVAPGAPVRWVPGAVFALALMFGLRWWRHYLALPALIVGAIVLFYGSLAVFGVSTSEAFRRGLLMGPFDQAATFPPVALSDLARADLRALGSQWGQFAAIAIISTLSTLLFTSGYEVATESELDLDRELGATGAANIASGLVMGWPGFIGMGGTLLGHKLGATGRWPGLVAGVVCVLPLAIGLRVFGYLPKAVLAGLLLWTGLSFLQETVVDKAGKLPRVEWLLMMALVLLVAVWGFLPAIGAGIVIATVLFAISYASIGVIRASGTASALRSNAARSEAEAATLDVMGDRLHVVLLQGYLFFGTAHALLEDAKKRLAGPSPASYLVLDFGHVKGVDSSAVQCFQRLRSLARLARCSLVLTDLPAAVEKLFQRSDVTGTNDDRGAARLRADLDRGLELCEDELLAKAASEPRDPAVLAREKEQAERLSHLIEVISGYAQRVTAGPDDEIFREGAEASDLLIVESGELSAFAISGGREKRLRAMGPGSIVGEVGLYLGQVRSATVRATRPSVFYRLERAALRRLAAEAPERTSVVHEAIATTLAARLAHATTSAQAWLR
jgi:SulP family sulfate permease